MSKKQILATAALCAFSAYAAAQVPTSTDAQGVPECMSIDYILSRISQHNPDVQSAISAKDATEQGISVAKSARLPHISASLDLSYIGDGTILDRDFTNAMRDKLPHFGNTLNVTLYQPIYQGGAINAGIDMANLQTDMARIGVSQQTDASSIQAVSAYLNLLKMRRLEKVYEENIDITRRLIEQMQEHFNQGTALKNDITRYELRLSSLEYDLSAIQKSVAVLNRNLTSLLALDPSVEIVPDESLSSIDPDLMDEGCWQALTLNESNELKAIDKRGEITDVSLKLDKAAMMPKIGIVIGDNLTGPVTFEIPAINKNYNAWFAGVSLSYDFTSLYTANKKMRQKRMELIHIDDSRKAMSEALNRRVHEAYMDAQQAKKMLTTETLNVRLANENYDVVETRFQNDMALLTDMLDASTAKLDAETRLVNAHINLLLGYYQLKFISGTLN